MLRKSDLQLIGGLASFSNHIAEDNQIAKKLWDLNKKLEMTSDLAIQTIEEKNITEYLMRISRWSRMRKFTNPVATFFEPFSESVFLGITTSIAMYSLFNVNPYIFIAIHMLVWLIFDMILINVLVGSKYVNVGCWMFREFTSFLVYLFSVCGSVVVWRGRRFVLLWDGKARSLWLKNKLKKLNKRKTLM